jgi:hypothetical protein
VSDTARTIEGTLFAPTNLQFPITATVDLHSIGETGPRFSVTDLRHKDGSKVAMLPGWKVEFSTNFAEAMGWTDSLSDDG